MNKVLLGLTTYNNYKFSYLALESIYRNTPKIKHGSCRVVVIDNNSNDETYERILKDFPWISKLIVSKNDCIAAQWNEFLDLLEDDEDFLMAPNDIVVGVNWLELLQEDTYRYDNVIVGSPYLNNDLQYDDVINQEWAENYLRLYPEIKEAKSADDLKYWLQRLYGDFDGFTESFQEANKAEPPIDSCVTHVMLFKNKLFKDYGFRFCEEYCPVFGSMEFDMICELNNLGYFRIASSRSYVHHWVSASNGVSTNMAISDKQRAIEKNNLHLLSKWEWIPGSTTFANFPSPSKIPNWRTPYHKWKKRDTALNETEAHKVPGIKFMSFEGLQPGHDYFDQIQPGSILRYQNNKYKIIGKEDGALKFKAGSHYFKGDDRLDSYIFKEDFNRFKYNIEYYKRDEEEAYFGEGHMDFLLK